LKKACIYLSLVPITLFLWCSASPAQTPKKVFESGVTHFKAGKYKQAVDIFTRLIDISPENADAYKNRGVAYMKLETFDLAIADFETAKQLFPELKGLYINFGVAWYHKKEYEKAIENYSVEIEANPENHIAYFNRALCLSEIGEPHKALSDLEKSLALSPDFYWAVSYQADLLATVGKTKQAVAGYERAVELDPDSPYAKIQLEKLSRNILLAGVVKDPSGSDLKTTATPPSKPEKPATGNYSVQTGAFLSRENAQIQRKKLTENGFNASVLVLQGKKNKTWYMVRYGGFESKTQADQVVEKLKKTMGLDAIVRPNGSRP
jgi:tetratricopeptide (TPR) repeat protein